MIPSVWIEVFRKNTRLDLEAIAPLEEIVLCLPVYQEVLQGFDDERAWRRAREALLAMPMIEDPLRQELFDEAISIFRRGRRAGLTFRSSVDCLIAACALRHELEIVHRDYDAIAKIVPLRSRRAM